MRKGQLWLQKFVMSPRGKFRPEIGQKAIIKKSYIYSSYYESIMKPWGQTAWSGWWIQMKFISSKFCPGKPTLISCMRLTLPVYRVKENPTFWQYNQCKTFFTVHLNISYSNRPDHYGFCQLVRLHKSTFSCLPCDWKQHWSNLYDDCKCWHSW